MILSIVSSEKELADSVLDSMVKPFVLTPIRMVIFLIIFGILSLILGILASKLTFINNIPIIGFANSVLGAVAGIIKALISLLIIAIIIKGIIIISENSIIFLNETTIQKTYLFDYFYNLDVMKFLNK